MHANATSTHAAARPVELYLCPCCHTVTPSLKSYRLYKFLLFVVIGWGAQTAEYTACPPCMRKIIAKLTLVNAIPANIVWPIVLVLHGIDFARSYTPGASKGVDSRLRIQ